jgi:hypothetical protein
MKKKTNTPGFTAEAALCNGKRGYQATARAIVYGGTVKPARFFFAHRSLPCLKFEAECGETPSNPANCVW